MTDIVDAATRSRMMSGIRSKDTKPELIVRKGLHRLGFRYRLHSSSLPGKPDLVFPKYRAVIFVNGCFWHGHDCHLFHMPGTRREFWSEKINGNKKRDREVLAKLEQESWRILQIWECAIKGKERVGIEAITDAAANWLKGDSNFLDIRGSGLNVA